MLLDFSENPSDPLKPKGAAVVYGGLCMTRPCLGYSMRRSRRAASWARCQASQERLRQEHGGLGRATFPRVFQGAQLQVLECARVRMDESPEKDHQHCAGVQHSRHRNALNNDVTTGVPHHHMLADPMVFAELNVDGLLREKLQFRMVRVFTSFDCTKWCLNKSELNAAGPWKCTTTRSG